MGIGGNASRKNFRELRGAVARPGRLVPVFGRLRGGDPRFSKTHAYWLTPDPRTGKSAGADPESKIGALPFFPIRWLMVPPISARSRRAGLAGRWAHRSAAILLKWSAKYPRHKVRFR